MRYNKMCAVVMRVIAITIGRHEMPTLISKDSVLIYGTNCLKVFMRKQLF